jgi:hypothetical protein
MERLYYGLWAMDNGLCTFSSGRLQHLIIAKAVKTVSGEAHKKSFDDATDTEATEKRGAHAKKLKEQKLAAQKLAPNAK